MAEIKYRECHNDKYKLECQLLTGVFQNVCALYNRWSRSKCFDLGMEFWYLHEYAALFGTHTNIKRRASSEKSSLYIKIYIWKKCF